MKTSADQSASTTQPTYPGDERTVNGLATDVPPDQHNLASCAAAFCDGELSRYLDLYDVVFHPVVPEKPSTNKTTVPNWYGWCAAIFQSLRQAGLT